MQGHATNEHVFIRSMATRGHLGGLSLAVPDAVAGPRRRELSTRRSSRPSASVRWRSRSPSAADTTIVVVNPGWGDAMQANKAGLLEVADIFVINKADRAGVRETRRDLDQMLDLGGAARVAPADPRDRRDRRRRVSPNSGTPSSSTERSSRAGRLERASTGAHARRTRQGALGDGPHRGSARWPTATPTRRRSTRCSRARPTPTARPRTLLGDA